jgi:hypothetical protein
VIQFEPVLLIIVGAGASFDSDWRRTVEVQNRYNHYDQELRGFSNRPPLAQDLFDEDRFGGHVAEYPPSQGLMVRLRNAAPAVEEELERIRSESTSQEHVTRQLLAIRYYLRVVVGETVEQWTKAKPDRITNFTRLLTGLEPWRQRKQERVTVVTFNYDTMFDEALINFLPQFHLREIGDYVADNRYRLFKLHGSVNWWRHVQPDWTRGSQSMSSPAGWAATMFDPPEPFQEDGPIRVGGGGYYPPVVPSLALPLATKGPRDFACPDDHLTGLRDDLDAATDVLVIGWRANENHFLELWRLVHVKRKDPSIRTIAIVDRSVNAGQEIAARVTHHVGLTPKRDLYYEYLQHIRQREAQRILIVPLRQVAHANQLPTSAGCTIQPMPRRRSLTAICVPHRPLSALGLTYYAGTSVDCEVGALLGSRQLEAAEQ